MIARLFPLFVALALYGAPAWSRNLVDIEVVDRNTGQTLQTHWHKGNRWVAGNPGNRYALRVVNRSGARILAVLSVDGVNVVTGQTASPDQSGYVLGPWERAEIAGWRKSNKEVAQFYFTALSDSYAARTDRPDNVGVIGVAAFMEKPRIERRVEPMASAPAGMNRMEADSAQGSARMKSYAEERLGTGHGQREYAPIEYTEFERANTSPNEVVSVRYDSRANLVASGVIPAKRYPKPTPEPTPFPGGFVPDPGT
jgi:hypothetical protein